MSYHNVTNRQLESPEDDVKTDNSPSSGITTFSLPSVNELAPTLL